MSSFVYANYDSDTQQSSDPDKPDLVRAVKNANGSVSLVGPDGVIGIGVSAEAFGASPDATAAVNNAAIQAALDVGGYVTLTTGGTYDILGHLALKDDTHFFMSPNVILKQQNAIGAGKTMLATDNYLNGVWQTVTLTWTAGQIIVSVALTDHGLEKGDYAVLRGAAQTEYIGVFLVVDVADSDNFTVMLRRCPTASPTGTIEFIKANKNITIEGGLIDYNMTEVDFNGTTPVENINVILAYGVNLRALNVGFADSSKYALAFGATANSGYDRIHGNSTSDGVKVYGPAFDFNGGEFFGHFGDDSISIHPYESDAYSQYRFTFGSILGATVGRMHNYSESAQLLAVYPHGTHYIDDLVIDGISGSGTNIVYIGGAAADTDYTCLIKKMTFKRTQFNRDNAGAVGFAIFTDTKPYIQELNFENCGSDGGGYTGGASNEIKLSCKVDRVSVKGGTWKGLKFTAGSTFICDVYSLESVSASEVSALCEFTSGTIGVVSVREASMAYSATIGGNQRIVVAGPNVAAVTVSESKASASMNALIYVASGQTNNPKITLKNSTVNSLAGVNAESRCIIEASGNVCNNTSNGLVRVRYSAETYKVYGEGNQYNGTSVPIAFVTTPIVHMYSNNFACDVTALTRITGAYCYNSNAAAGTLGSAGLVICQGTAANSWKLLADTSLAY